MLPEKKRILLADDDPDVLLGIRDRLESFGFQVTAVSNGREAVEAMTLGGYAMVIMDVTMPEMDGIEALRMIRLRHPATPVLVITSNVENAVTALVEGAHAYLLKPIDHERLRATVDRLVREDS
ncbi:MAG: response regulator [Nitrospirota bacterium]